MNIKIFILMLFLICNIRAINSDSLQNELIKNKYTLDSLNKIPSPLYDITSYNIADINFVGGVSINITCTNNSTKIIKYYNFYVRAFNAVDDEVFSDLSYNKTYKNLEVVGPIEKNSSNTYYWENVWYNSTIKYFKIIKVEITYMDNTTSIVNNLNIIINKKKEKLRHNIDNIETLLYYHSQPETQTVPAGSGIF